MALKDAYFIYSSKKFETGLTDVTAKVRRNGSYVLGTDTTPLPLTELDNGRYQLILSPAQLTTAGGAGHYQVDVDSASKSAPATATRVITVNDPDDIITTLTSIESKIDTVDSNVDQLLVDVADVKTVVDDTNSEVKNGTYGLNALKVLVDAIQSTVDNISNVTRFSAPIPDQLVKLETGAKAYKIPVRLFDNNGNPEDPDSEQIQLLIKNESGVARDSYIVGFTSQPHYITRTATGIYEFELSIPDTAPDEPLIFEFVYAENTVTNSQVKVSEIVLEQNATGLALESTAQAILADTDDMQPRVLDIQSVVNNATFGLSALKTLIDALSTAVAANNSELTNATYGLSAIKLILDGKASQVSVDAITTNLNDNVKGAGFDNATDSLKAISDRIFTGGIVY